MQFLFLQNLSIYFLLHLHKSYKNNCFHLSHQYLYNELLLLTQFLCMYHFGRSHDKLYKNPHLKSCSNIYVFPKQSLQSC